MKRSSFIILTVAVVVLAAAIGVGCTAAPGAPGAAGPPGPVGATGPQGPAGKPAPLPSGTDTGMDVTVSLSKPANGTHFVAGEKPVVTVTLKDKLGGSLTKDDFATLNLYAYGPQETTKTVTAVKLLNANTDRSKTPHHYIDLLKDTNVQVEGNNLKYTFQPVSDEEPGTYTVSVWAVKKGDPPVNQAFILADFQLGTATVEKQVVEKEKCATCHLGASNGQFYFHHVDPGRSPYGNPAIDSVPVGTCKSCHNNNGYAAYAGNIADPTASSDVRTADPIVRRVHGVHFGEALKNAFNNDPKAGNFSDYLGVVFPKDILNCTACHVDDRWKTEPSRVACGACHDNIWFGAVASMPKTFEAHKGGPQADDKGCAGCHPADSGGAKAIAEAHDPKIHTEHDTADLSMSAPANGKFYVAGEKPVLNIVIKDEKGSPIDHTTMDNKNYSTARLNVYGPREHSVPVLTSAAKVGNSKSSASASNYTAASGTPTAGWTFEAGDTFKIAVNRGAVQELAAPTGLQTPDQVAAWLTANLKDVTVTADSKAGTVTIKSKVLGDNSRIEIYNSAVTTKMGWKRGGLDIIKDGKVVGQTSGVTMEPLVYIGAASSTVANDLRVSNDPALKRTKEKITYQLDDVAGLKPGTYMAYVYWNVAGVETKNGWPRGGFGLVTFQIGTETPELKVADNCERCHGNTIMHLNESHVHSANFDPDYCKACHDYERGGTGEGYARVGGTSTSGWAGYGAKPIVARVHGVHRGAYLEHPEEVYEGNPNMASEIIFPQDIRNCTVCHDPKMSPAWKEEPSRLACLSCHDSDSAKAHAKQMTQPSPNPDDPWGSDAIETCKICHGAGKDFSPDKVHNISNPYKPPYPREP